MMAISDVELLVYAVFAGCFVLRMVDIATFTGDPDMDDRILSYDLLACLAPFLCPDPPPPFPPPRVIVSNSRLQTTPVPRLLPLLRHNAHRPKENDQRDRGVLSFINRHRSGIPSKFLLVPPRP